MKKIFLVVGTRPESIKMAPVYHALANKKLWDLKLVSTGQHRELLYQALESFSIKPAYDLKVMQKNQSLSQITTKILQGLERLFKIEKPDIILGHGDTTTCFATSVSCFYHGIPFFHVEAGLRSFCLGKPFPEEFNRQFVTRMALHHFAPSVTAKDNLIKEGVAPCAVSVTGSTVVDALHFSVKTQDHGINLLLTSHSKKVLCTLHRRELGASLKEMIETFRKLAMTYPDTVFIFPVHPNPRVREEFSCLANSGDNVFLLDPLSYPDFLSVMLRSSLILTDSGGVQEEASYLGKKVLVLRDQTERPDGIEEGYATLVGTQPSRIFTCVSEFLNTEEEAETNCVLPLLSHSPAGLIADKMAELVCA